MVANSTQEVTPIWTKPPLNVNGGFDKLCNNFLSKIGNMFRFTKINSDNGMDKLLQQWLFLRCGSYSSLS